MVILENGDIKLGPRGEVLEVQGREAKAQEAVLQLRARRGAFALCPELGSGLWKLDLTAAEENDVLAAVMEALLPVEGVEVLALERKLSPRDGRLELFLRLRIGEEEKAVSLNGNDG